MESTSKKGMIQVSKETADILLAADKADWLEEREDLVDAKGKGALRTYWLKLPGTRNRGSSKGGSSVSSESNEDFLGANVKLGSSSSGKLERLIDWNCESLMKLLEQIVARNEVSETNGYDNSLPLVEHGMTPLENVKEIIHLPEFDRSKLPLPWTETSGKVDETVARELRDLVACVASMYRENPFHNFEHASHVVMSVSF